jgi:hypothetical protein
MASGSNATTTETQLRECCAQMERRLLKGEACRAEEFLTAHPAIANDPESALDLIYAEYMVRLQQGQSPPPEEYYSRFPQWRDLLFHQFQVHALLSTGASCVAGKSQDAATTSGKVGPWKANPKNFDVLAQIARGTSGIVYNAWQKSPPRVVALKAFPALALGSDEQLARFRREAAAAARLIHPNIVHLYTVSEWEEIPYLVMECVDGGTLSDKWAGVAQPPTEVASVVLTLARAVEYAHQRGVVHRDLRPRNVLLTGSGEPKITDFGLAKLMVAAGEELTLADQVLGTPGYMSPEQAEGRSRDAGAPADVYALGSLLYEGLTGRPPFRGKTVVETLHLVTTQPPVPPGRIQPGVPRDLEGICLKCLQKAPEARYPSAAALAEDLRRFLVGEPTVARPLRLPERVWRWCRRNPLAACLSGALAGVALVAFALVSWTWRQEMEAQDRLRVTETALREKLLAEEKGRRADRLGGSLLDTLTISPEVQGNATLALLGLGQSLSHSGRIGDSPPVFARAGLQEAMSEALRRRWSGDLSDRLPAVVHSPDGRRFVTVSDKAAQVWESETGKAIGPPLRHEQAVWTAAFSPDSEVLLTGCGDPPTDTGMAYLWTVATGQPIGPPVNHEKPIVSIAFTRDGQTLLIRDVEKAQLWDRASRKPVAALAHPGTVLTSVLSPDGRTALTGGEDGSARLWRIPGGQAGPAVYHNPPAGVSAEVKQHVVAAAFSPDGRLVATAAQLTQSKTNRRASCEARVWHVATGEPLTKAIAIGP